MEQISLILFLYHNLPFDYRKQCLVELASKIIELRDNLKSQLTSSKSNLVAGPQLLTRLVFLVDYVLSYFNEPSISLLDVVENHLLAGDLSPSASEKANPNGALKSLMSKLDNSSHGNNLFYTLNDSRRASALDATLLSSGNYDSFYASLLDFLRLISLSERQATATTTAITSPSHMAYHFHTIWSLIVRLPVPNAHLDRLVEVYFKKSDDKRSIEELNEPAVVDVEPLDLLQLLRLIYDPTVVAYSSSIKEWFAQKRQRHARLFDCVWSSKFKTQTTHSTSLLVAFNYHLCQLAHQQTSVI